MILSSFKTCIIVANLSKLNHKSLILLLVVGLFFACKPSESETNFKQYYDYYGVNGSFVLYDLNEDQYTFFNKSQFETRFTPASTFKICNALIGLETGVIPDEHYVIKWDGVERIPKWNKDHDLKTAFKNSTVWYFQELARRVNSTKMEEWVKKSAYGNQDITGGIDVFWLEGGLRISPKEQLSFLRNLYAGTLPFSERAMNIVKDIITDQETENGTLRGKTGWGKDGDQEIGWYVGYIETKGNVYFFVNCIQAPSNNMEDIDSAVFFDQSRKAITLSILADMQII